MVSLQQPQVLLIRQDQQMTKDYRKDLKSYVQHKYGKCLHRHRHHHHHHHDGAFEYFSRLVEKAYALNYPVMKEPLRLPITKVLYDCYKKVEGTDAVFELEAGTSLLKWSCAKEKRVTWQCNKDTLTHTVQFEKAYTIGLFGKWTMSLVSKKLSSCQYFGEFSFANSPRIPEGEVSTCTIPMYDSTALADHITRRIPACMMQLTVRMLPESKMNVLGVSVRCIAAPTSNALIYTPPIALDCAPTMRLTDSPHSFTPSSVNLNQQQCESYLSSVFTGGSCYSLSVNAGSRRAFSLSGSKEHHVGGIGELLFSHEVIRKIGERRSSASNYNGLMQELEDPFSAEKWLDVESVQILKRSYKALYDPTADAAPVLPSIAQLLTHTAGLPEHKCLQEACYAPIYQGILNRDASKDDIVACAPPGAIFRHSKLGLSLCRNIVPDYSDKSFALLGMTNTRLCYDKLRPEELPYAPIFGVHTTTDDLASYMCQLWRACEAPHLAQHHKYLVATVNPYASVTGAGSDSKLHSFSLGGWESVMIKLPLHNGTEIEKVGSVSMLFKFGETQESWTVMCMVPGVNVAFALTGHCLAPAFFANLNLKKFLKRVVLSLLHNNDRKCALLLSGEFDQTKNIAYGPRRLPLSLFPAWAKASALLPTAPPEGILTEDVLGARLLPIAHVMSVIAKNAQDHKDQQDYFSRTAVVHQELTELIFEKSQLHSISIREPSNVLLRGKAASPAVEYEYVVVDSVLKREWALVWDSEQTCFRTVGIHDHVAGDYLRIERVKDTDTKVVQMFHYGGTLYVSEVHIKQLLHEYVVVAERRLSQKRQIEANRNNSRLRPWMAVVQNDDDQIIRLEQESLSKQHVLTRYLMRFDEGSSEGSGKNIQSVFGAFLLGGLLGGLTVAALRPRYYYRYPPYWYYV